MMTKRLLLFAAAVLAVVLTVAACGAKSQAATVSLSTTVGARQVGGLGNILISSSGLPLYANNQDQAGTVKCTGACAMVWHPVTVKGAPTETGVSGTLRTVTLANGTKQVTLNGKPLYTFVQDKPVQVTGNGAQDQFGGTKFAWHVMLANGTPSSSSAESTGSGGSSSSGPHGY